MKSNIAFYLTLALILLFVPTCFSQVGKVTGYQKISDVAGNFTGILDNEDRFGWEIGALEDLDLDGVKDMLVGARNDDDGGYDRGAVWILFMNPDGTVKNHSKISSTSGSFGGVLDDEDRFGYAVTALGDLDGDNVEDIAVGARHDDDGGFDRGALWILFLNGNGTVKSYQKISQTQGNLNYPLANDGCFGSSVANIGDMDGDGITDIAVGATKDPDGGSRRGAIWIIFLNSNGTVKSSQKISDTEGGFYGQLDYEDYFGSCVAALDDFDGDGIREIAVGAHSDDDGGEDRGALWILYLHANATVKAFSKISDLSGSFAGNLNNGDHFGFAVEYMDDMDGDGILDITVGASWDDDGGLDRGAVWVLFLNPDASVKSFQKISSLQGNFTGILDDNDRFGESLQVLGDLNNDQHPELAVGASFDDDGGYDRGAVWILSLEAVPSFTLQLDLKAFLEGPFSGSGMEPFLNNLNYIPLSQPYNTAPWLYTGTESVSVIPSASVVDWILVELRVTTGSASTAVPDSSVARVAGFILSDGTIRSTDATSLLTLQYNVQANLYAVVYHRDHLAVMSPAPLIENGNIYSWNFSSGPDQVHGGILAHKELGGGLYGLLGGDGDGNGEVQNQDKLEVWRYQAGQIGYLSGDYNMNGQVQNEDKIDIWNPNAGRGSKVPGGYFK